MAVRLGFREADEDERRPQRVLVWPSGATVVTGVYSGLLVVGLVVGAGVDRLIKDEEVS